MQIVLQNLDSSDLVSQGEAIVAFEKDQIITPGGKKQPPRAFEPSALSRLVETASQ